MYLTDLINLFEQLGFPQATTKPKTCTFTSQPISTCNHPKVFRSWACPTVKRVTFNGNTTIVFFEDNTYAVVKCSPEDRYDRKTAVVYAIAKRMFGTLGKTDKNGKFHANEVDGKGFASYIQDIVDNGFDQELEEKTALEKKRQAHEAHEARQAAQRDAAFKKRVEARAKEILLERAALDRANQIEDDARCTTSCKQCTCNATSEKAKGTKKAVSMEYVRPNKPFKDFSDEEKKEYWRYHNAKRKASKK